ncbi:MAG: FAD-binding oxidoreductase [Thermoflavifilum sp.]|nr:FAD-binding oxidoreductase [Thermoflavifilum sp.]MCL6514956.1 FAD-binding oxidoreductase [Alicyclobacillus sp.]
MAEARVISPQDVCADVGQCVGNAAVAIESGWNEAAAGIAAPVAVARPTTEDRVAALVRLAAERGWRLLPAGRGRQLSWGNLGQPVDLVVSTAAMKEVAYYSPADLVISVQPGMTWAELSRVLAAEGQMLPVDPFVPDDATIGGIVSTAASGPRRALYGALRDMVIGLRVVWGDGRVIRTGGRVVKNVAGYDMTKLFIGALGTLGVLTEVTFKLRPLPLHRATVLLSGDVQALRTVAHTVMTSELIPSRLELVLRGDASRGVLAIDCDEPSGGAAYQIQRLRALAQEQGLSAEVLDGDVADNWWRMHRASAMEAPVCLRISGKPTRLTAQAAAWRTVCAEAGFETLWSITVPAGMARIFLSSTADADGVRVRKLVEQLRQAAGEVGGQVVVERAPAGVRRGIDVFGGLGASRVWMEGIKRTADPHGLLCPGRFAGGI